MAGIRDHLSKRRDRLRERPLADFAYRVGVAVVGLTVLLVGVAAILFLGLAILASEFYWAQRTLKFTRDRYNTAMWWLRRQPWWVQALGAVLTGAVVVGTLWLFGAIDWAAGLFGLQHPMLRSPIGLGA